MAGLNSFQPDQANNGAINPFIDRTENYKNATKLNIDTGFDSLSVEIEHLSGTGTNRLESAFLDTVTTERDGDLCQNTILLTAWTLMLRCYTGFRGVVLDFFQVLHHVSAKDIVTSMVLDIDFVDIHSIRALTTFVEQAYSTELKPNSLLQLECNTSRTLSPKGYLKSGVIMQRTETSTTSTPEVSYLTQVKSLLSLPRARQQIMKIKIS